MLRSNPEDFGRASGFVRRIYLLRCLGFCMGAVPLSMLLHAQHAPPWLYGAVLSICFAWPHVAYLTVRSSPMARRAERRNLIIDAALGGWLVAAVHFAPIAAVVILLMFTLDDMAVGGWRLFGFGSLAMVAGLLLGLLCFGPPQTLNVDPVIALAWLPVAVVYPLVLAKTTHDVSMQLIQHSRRMRELGERDSLTGLANRATVTTRLQALLARAHATNERVAVLFIDLDGFKTVNDALGHAAGDMLLTEVAARLAACTHEGDIVSRYGGDEFVIVTGWARAGARRSLPDTVLSALAAPVNVVGHELVIGASIGISVCPSDGNDAQALLRAADIAMYAAKTRGRNCYEFYRQRMRVAADARLKLSAKLRRALEMGTLVVHYQPQVDMRTGDITGFEALARWRDEEYGDVSPVDFVSVAESSGLVSQLGEFVLRAACAQAAMWRRMRPVRVSINLSPIQLLRPDIVDTFRRVVEETSMDPRLLELEVTETALMRNPETAVRLLHAFREDGVSVAIDDFGIGYSSLGQLRALPVDRIKIDRTFVRGIGHGDSGAIATAIVTLARALGIAVIAEGVETLAQKDFLVAHGCVEAQGFLYSRPLPAERATALLAAGGSLRAQPSTPDGGAAAVIA